MAETFFGHLDSIRGNADAIRSAKEHLDRVIEDTVRRMKAGINEKTAPSLIWDLSLREFVHVNKTIADLANARLSDFAGQAQHLRALAAAVEFRVFDVATDPRTDSLLEDCKLLWEGLMHREMMENFSASRGEQFKQRDIAAWMSLACAFQRELQYVEQVEARYLKIFGPVSRDIVEPVLGILVEEIHKGFGCVRELILDRFHRARADMGLAHRRHREYMAAVGRGASESELQAIIAAAGADEHMPALFERSMETISEILVFTEADLQGVLGERSRSFLEAFSFVPGEVNQNYRTPFDQDAVRSRPFARFSGGKYLLMEIFYSNMAPLYRLAECADTEKMRLRVTARRDHVLEQDADGLLSEVVAPEIAFRNYYLPVGKDETAAERDLFMVRDGTALIVECKAKPLRDVSGHRGNLAKIESDVKQSIQVGYDQAASVFRYLQSAEGEVVFWDSGGPNAKELGRLSRDHMREILGIVVLDSYYGMIATDLEPWLKRDEEFGFPWVVSRDVLETIFSVMKNREEFFEFLRWRKGLHGRVIGEDEAVIAGFYLRHGPEELPKEEGIVQFAASYGDIFEAEYFRSKGIHVEIPTGRTQPVWSTISREGDEVVFRIDDKVEDRIDIYSGRSIKDGEIVADGFNEEQAIPAARSKKIGRNEPCPCGSGKKFKRCCLPRN